MLDPNLLKIFLRAAQHLNFAAAASELRVAPSQVSKGISALEETLGKRLFLRTTRQVRLSAEGELFVPIARRALESLQEALGFFGEDESGELSGNLRVSCSNTLGIRRLAKLAAKFHALHPKVTLECELSDHHVDLLEGGIDVAVRIMKLHESSLMARKLAEIPMVFCASPAYLEKHGEIRTVSDLSEHPLLFIPDHARLRFAKAGKELRKVGRGAPVIVGSGDFLVELAVGGAGVVVRPRWGVDRELATGSLREIPLKDRLIVTSAIYAVFDANRFQPKRVRAWLEFLVAEFSERSKAPARD